MGVQVSYVGWANIKSSLDKKSKQANLDALTAVAERVIQDTEPFVPKKTGKLRESAEIKSLNSDGFELQYKRRIFFEDEEGNSHYVDGADYLYQGINPVTERPITKWTTQGTGPFWVEESLEANQDDWFNEFTRDWVRSFTKGGAPSGSGITR